MESKYKIALQEGYLFKTSRGMITTQDLFTLPLQGSNGFNLDKVAQTIAADIKAEGEESFVTTGTVNPTNSIKLEIVKDIIADKLAAKQARLNAKTKADKKAKLRDILSRKQDESLEAKTEAEILAELEALDA